MYVTITIPRQLQGSRAVREIARANPLDRLPNLVDTAPCEHSTHLNGQDMLVCWQDQHCIEDITPQFC